MNRFQWIDSGNKKGSLVQGWPLWCSLLDKLFRLELYESSYVGQTKRKLKTRIKEHKADTRRSTDTMSVVSHHQFDNEYELDWENISVLDIEQSLYNRRISEIIQNQRRDIHKKKSDTEGLPDVYLPLLK